MKTQPRIAPLLVLTILCLVLASVPASAQGLGLLYDNGPALSSQGAPARISQGDVVTNQIQFQYRGTKGYSHYVNSFKFSAWVWPWDSVDCVNWSIDSQPFGPFHSPATTNHNYGNGKSCSPQDLSAVYLFQEISPPGTSFLWDIYDVVVSFPDVKLPSWMLDTVTKSPGPTTVYLTLWGNSKGNDRLYWHKDGATGAVGNDGKGGGVSDTAYLCDTTLLLTCNVNGSNIFQIPSESFDIMGYEQ